VISDFSEDDVLDKINELGMNSLDEVELQVLKNV
jgi:hypothetical protein